MDFSILSQEQAARFPAHGWAHNADGVQLLWFPLKSLLLDRADEIRKRLGARPCRLRGVDQLSGFHESEVAFIPKDGGLWGIDSEVEPVGGRISRLPFYSTLNELVWMLGRLHCLIQTIEAMPFPLRSDEELSAWVRAQGEFPILLKSAFIWLRSILDLFAFHARCVLFDNFDECPDRFFKLKKDVSDDRRANRWKPLVNLQALRIALDGTSMWTDILRDPAGGHRGVRDSIVHASCRILFGANCPELGPAKVTAYLTGDPSRRELISCLCAAVAGFCELCTQVHALVDVRTVYERGDVMFNCGIDSDLCGFWPRI